MNIRMLRDDAFLYKDLTQWLRRRTFLPLFFGLLMAGEVVTVAAVASGDGGSEGAGQAILSNLITVLFFFALVVLVQGFFSLVQEISSRSFELHMLSGIQPFKIIWSKCLSLLFQFMFGLCCLAPFIFLSVLQGSVDYWDMLLGASVFLALFPLLILWVTGTGFAVGKCRTIWGRISVFVGMFFLLLLIMIVLLLSLVSASYENILSVLIGLPPYFFLLFIGFGVSSAFVPYQVQRPLHPSRIMVDERALRSEESRKPEPSGSGRGGSVEI